MLNHGWLVCVRMHADVQLEAGRSCLLSRKSSRRYMRVWRSWHSRGRASSTIWSSRLS